MRADRSEAAARTASSSQRCPCEDRYGEEKEGSRARRRCGKGPGRRRQPPLCERGLPCAGGRPHRGQGGEGRGLDPRRQRLGDAADGRRHQGSRGDRPVGQGHGRRCRRCADRSRRLQHGQQRRRRRPRDDGPALRGLLARRLLRRLPVRPRGGAPPGPARPRHGALHRRLGLAARPAALRRLQRHQGRPAPAGAVAGARVRPAGPAHRPRHHRRRHRGRAAAVAHARPQGEGRRRRSPEHRGHRRQLLAPAYASTAAPGRTRSTCARTRSRFSSCRPARLRTSATSARWRSRSGSSWPAAHRARCASRSGRRSGRTAPARRR